MPPSSRCTTKTIEAVHAVGQGSGFVIATHSPVLLDPTAPTRDIWLVRAAQGRIAASVQRVTGLDEVADQLGVEFADVLAADRILITEGTSDAAIIQNWFCDLIDRPGSMLVDGRTSGMIATHVQMFEAWLQRIDSPNRRLLFLRDHDEMESFDVDRLNARPTVRVLERREIENYLLDIPAITGRLRDRGVTGDIDPVDLESLLDEIADGLRPVVLLKRLRNAGKLGSRLNYDKISELASQSDPLHSVIDYLSTLSVPDASDVQLMWEAESTTLAAEWADRRLEIAPGEEILKGVFTRYGLEFQKSTDGPAIARHMVSGPTEIRGLIIDFLSSPS